MINSLSVRNYALIEKLEVEFHDGFSVITGETGSGKSIVLGALGLLMGDRADFKTLKNKDLKCVVEGTFQLKKKHHFPFFKQHDLDYEDHTLIRREILPSGKSRAFINDTPVNLSQLKELGNDLLDIHSQHQTMLLNKTSFQFDVLDAASSTQKIKQEYTIAYNQFKTLQQELQVLLEEENKANTDKDYFTFLLKDFEAIDIASIDLNELEEEFKLLQNAEEIIRTSSDVTNSLELSDGSVISQLREVQNALSKLSEVNDTYAELYKRIESSVFEIVDINEEVAKIADSIEINEYRAQELSELLDKLYALQKKHNADSLEGLLTVKEDLETKLEAISSIDVQIETKREQLNIQLEEVEKIGKELTGQRIAGIVVLENQIKKYLTNMAMPHAELKVKLDALKEPSKNGMESIEFLVKTNKGGEFEALKKVASGGELSRLMLSIKAILCQSGDMSSIVFDEIDTGVGGEVANMMADIMKQMSKNVQVMSITHLAQIASKGQNHYKVLKNVSSNTTTTEIVQLSDEDRLIEVAKMLSGENPSEAALLNAKELLS